MRRILRSLEEPFELVKPPGSYADRPAYVRVCRAQAGENWQRDFPGLALHRVGSPSLDSAYDFVYADHTIGAFAYLPMLLEAGLPAAGLAVVRLAAGERRQHVQGRAVGGPR